MIFQPRSSNITGRAASIVTNNLLSKGDTRFGEKPRSAGGLASQNTTFRRTFICELVAESAIQPNERV